MFPHLHCIFIPFFSGIVTLSNMFPNILLTVLFINDFRITFFKSLVGHLQMRTYNEKVGKRIVNIINSYEPKGIAFNELVRQTGYAKDTIDDWLDRLRNSEPEIIRKLPTIPIHLTEYAIRALKNGNLSIPPDPRGKKVEKNHQRKKQLVIKEFGKNYAEIIILILCLAVFGSIKAKEYKKSNLGLVIIPNPIDSQQQQTYMYGATTKKPLPGVGLSDLINKLPNKSSDSPNKKAFLPKYYTNYCNNELFGYLRLSQENAQKYITLLSEEYKILIPIIKSSKKYYNETRYEISDKLLNEFVKQCILAFNSDVDQRLEYAYICDFLNGKQVKEYFKFLKKWYGRNRKYSNISTYINRSKDIGVDTISKEHYRNYINKCDRDISSYDLFESEIIKCEHDKYELIIGKKYKPLQEKFPFIVDIFFNILFPQFLRKIWYYRKNHSK